MLSQNLVSQNLVIDCNTRDSGLGGKTYSGWLRKTLPEGVYPTPTLPDPKSTQYVPIRPISQISENTTNPNSA